MGGTKDDRLDLEIAFVVKTPMEMARKRIERAKRAKPHKEAAQAVEGAKRR